MAKFKTTIKFFLGSVLILIGVLSIFLQEPLYGIGILLMGVLIFPTVTLFKKIAPKVFTTKNTRLILAGLGIVIFAGLSLQGRKKYNVKEPQSRDDISKLSVHDIASEEINGLNYYYIEKGEGPAVFLLHGFPDMANTWDETIEELSKDYRVIAPFLRGYYPSEIPKDGDYSMKTIGTDIVALADALGINKFSILGQDWGGSITYAVANLVPERVTCMTTIAIPHPSAIVVTQDLLYFGRHFIVFNIGKSWPVRYTRKKNFQYIDRLYRRWSPDMKDYQESSDAIKETFKYEGRLEAALGYYWSLTKDQPNKEMAKFYNTLPKAPVLYLGGLNDNGVTPEIVDAMKNKMPENSQVITYENAGHFLHREIFSQFIGDLKPFLDKYHLQTLEEPVLEN